MSFEVAVELEDDRLKLFSRVLLLLAMLFGAFELLLFEEETEDDEDEDTESLRLAERSRLILNAGLINWLCSTADE